MGPFKLGSDKIAFALVGLATIAAIGYGARIAYQRTRVYHATLAAGSSSTESFVLMRALKTVVELHYPRVKLNIVETSGTRENLASLASGKVQFAVARGDVMTPRPARIVARLFTDVIQIVVPKDSEISTFAGLKGKRIAVGQRDTFLLLARPFGLHRMDFSFVDSNDDTAAENLAGNAADALFALRPLHTMEIARLTEAGAVRFIPLDNVEALRQDLPAYESATILKDSYQSDPPVPEFDIPTVSVDRLLLARENVPNDVVFSITQILMERREEIALAVSDLDDWVRSLAAGIRPAETSRWSTPVHPGAALYYAGGELTFSNVEVSTACVVIALLSGFWMLAIYLFVRTRQKAYSDYFNLTMMKLVEESKSTEPHWPGAVVQAVSLELLTGVVKDFCEDKISARSFQSSRTIWQVASQLLRSGQERDNSLASTTTSPVPPKAEERRQAPSKPRRWSILRDH